MNIPRWERFAFGADNHGDRADESTVSVFIDFVDNVWHPHHRIAGGDGFDCRPLRRKASMEEQREHLGPDFAAGKDFLSQYRPTHYLLGNHEFRLWDRAMNDSGAVQELCQKGVDEIEALCESLGTTVYPYDARHGVAQIGNLKFLHGYYCGETAAKRHALVYGNCLFGHVHAISQETVSGLNRHTAQSVGMLGMVDQPYNATKPGKLRHANGFAYGVIDKVTGDYHVWQAEKKGGGWILPSDVEAYE